MTCRRGHTSKRSADGHCRDCNRAAKKARYHRQPLSLAAKFCTLKNRAKQTGQILTITFLEFQELQKQSCFYCGEPLPQKGAGIDRIDSSLGYISGNCRSCCADCNLAKLDKSEKEFKQWIIRVFKHWITK